MNEVCPICARNLIDSPWAVAVGMCTTCANKFGVMPMLPARRPPVPCQRCNGMQFIRAVPREFTAKGNDYVTQVASPMTVTYELQIDQGIFSKSAADIDTRKAYGHLEQYICRKCGFVEWYCNDPARIPIGAAYMTESIDYGASDTPYRG